MTVITALDAARDVKRLDELALREAARRLMHVRKLLGVLSYNVPTAFKTACEAATIWEAGRFSNGQKISRWMALSDFALEGASIARISGWYRLPHGVAEREIRAALAELSLLTERGDA